MAERVTTLRLRAEIADLKRKMTEAGVSVEGVGSAAEKASQRSTAALDSLSSRAGLLGAAMVAAAGVAVKAFADFDQEMSAVQAATHESASNMGLLRDAALEAGKRTVYSATEAAGAIEELAKAGLSTSDILNGGLNGALDLAAAGALSVSEAAGIASIALQQFKLPGSEASHVADLLAAGAGKAMGSVSDLGMALRQAGQVANSTGLTIEETTAGLAAFASAGLLGSDAGTSFKAMLQRLTPQSAEAQKEMDRLGISAYDASGNFIGLADFAGNLQGALKDLTPEQRNAALATIFGSDAVRAATVLYDEGAQGIRDWTEAVDDQGYASETAAIRLNNLKGDLEQLRGSVETAFISMGESADGPLRSVVQSATDIVNAFTELPDVIQGGTLALVGGGGLVLLGVAGLGKMIGAVKETATAIRGLSTTSKVAGGAVGAALAVGTVALTLWAEDAAKARERTDEFAATLDEFGKTTTDTMSHINDVLSAQGETNWLEDAFGVKPDGSAIELARALGIEIKTLQDYVMGSADAFEELHKRQLDALGAGDQGTALMVGMLTDKLDVQRGALSSAEQAALQKAEADRVAADSADQQAVAIEAATGAMAAQIPTLEDLIDAQREAAGVVLSEREAQRQLQESLDAATEALKENGQTLDITTEKGRANQSALDDVAGSTWDLIDAMQANGATQEALQAQMASARQAFIDTAIAEGMSADEASRLADSMNLIPAKVAVAVSVDTSAAEARLESFKRLLKMPDVIITADMRLGGGYYANRAEGGIVYGPGSSTSDSIPARLSNGEYVVKAAAVQHYGKSTFDALNAQRFAAGGYVSGGGSGSGGGMAPIDYGRLARTLAPVLAAAVAGVQIGLDGRVLSQSVGTRLGEGMRW